MSVGTEVSTTESRMKTDDWKGENGVFVTAEKVNQRDTRVSGSTTRRERSNGDIRMRKRKLMFIARKAILTLWNKNQTRIENDMHERNGWQEESDRQS